MLHSQRFSNPRLSVMFLNKDGFYSVRLLASHQTPKLEDHSWSAVHDCSFNIFTANLHIWRPTPPSATRGDVVTGTYGWILPTIMLFNLSSCHLPLPWRFLKLMDVSAVAMAQRNHASSSQNQFLEFVSVTKPIQWRAVSFSEESNYQFQ